MKERDSLRYFVRGMGSAINLIPSSYDFFERPRFQSDAEALAEDWKNVGGDIQKSMDAYEYEAEHQKKEKTGNEE